MPPDPKSWHTASTRLTPHDRTSVSKPLGRGLGDISQLFLSQPAASAPPEPARAPLGAEPLAESRAGVAVLRHGFSLTRAQLIATLKECESALEADVRVLDAAIGCSPYGEIDLLAVDRANRLTVIDIETAVSDGLLERGLSHVDWVVENIANVRRMFPASNVDLTCPPRLMLVASRFPLPLAAALRQLPQHEIACFRYQEVELSGKTGIFVERLRDERE
jgi:hypothetical protein